MLAAAYYFKVKLFIYFKNNFNFELYIGKKYSIQYHNI